MPYFFLSFYQGERSVPDVAISLRENLLQFDTADILQDPQVTDSSIIIREPSAQWRLGVLDPNMKPFELTKIETTLERKW